MKPAATAATASATGFSGSFRVRAGVAALLACLGLWLPVSAQAAALSNPNAGTTISIQSGGSMTVDILDGGTTPYNNMPMTNGDWDNTPPTGFVVTPDANVANNGIYTISVTAAATGGTTWEMSAFVSDSAGNVFDLGSNPTTIEAAANITANNDFCAGVFPDPNNPAVVIVGGPAVTFFPLVNDVVLSGDPLTLVAADVGIAFGTGLATVAVTADGQGVIITPTPGGTGTGRFYVSYRASNANNLADVSSPAVICAVVVAPTNAVDDGLVATTPEDTPVDVRWADLLANDLTGTASLLGSGVVTSVTVDSGGGSVTLDATARTLTYTPAANFVGTATFTYEVVNNLDPDEATFSIDITSVDDTPTAVDDTVTLVEDGGQTDITVLANDHDGLNGSGLPLGNGADGALRIVAIGALNPPAAGTVTVPGLGSISATEITYQPALNFNGTATVTYTIRDDNSSTSGSDTATLTITVTPVDDTPTAVNDSYTTNEDTTLVISDLTGNDTGIDGAVRVVGVTTTGTNGAVTINSDTQVTYVPNANFNGTDSFVYTVRDDADATSSTATATVTITVVPVDDAPVASNDNYTTDEDVTLTITDATNNDTGIDGTVRLTAASVAASQGAVSVDSTTQLTYTPATNFNGTATITYTIRDDAVAGSLTANGTITVTVNAIDDAPTAVNDNATTDEDTPLTITNALSNDHDGQGGSGLPFGTGADGPIRIVNAVVGAAAQGTVTFSDTMITYTPARNYNGTASITYTIRDDTNDTPPPGSATDDAVITVTVNAVNDIPDAITDRVSTNEDTQLTGIRPLEANPTSPDEGDPPLRLVGSVGDSLTVTPAEAGTASITSLTTVEFTPATNYFTSGSSVVEIAYSIQDLDNETDSGVIQVTVNAQLDDAATARDDPDPGDTSVRTPVISSSPTTINVLDNDFGDPPLSIVGTLTVNPASVGTAAISAAGDAIIFTPVTLGDVDITYTMQDAGQLGGGADTDTATVRLTVTAALAADDAVTTDEDTSATFNPLVNDFGVLPLQVVATPTLTSGQGTVTLAADNAMVTYVPAPDYNGITELSYTMIDNAGNTDPAVITITVNSVDDPLVARDDPTQDATVPGTERIIIDEDTSLTAYDPRANDEGDPPLTITSATVSTTNIHTGNLAGTVTVSGGSTITFMPEQNFSGDVDIVYEVMDTPSGSDPVEAGTANIYLQVTEIPEDPLGVNDGPLTTMEEVDLVVDPLDNDNGDLPLTLVNVSVDDPAYGTAVIQLHPVTGNPTQVLYTPAVDFVGTAIINYEMTDVDLVANSTAQIIVEVTQVDDLPDAVDDSLRVPFDMTVTVSPLDNDTFAGGEGPLTITNVTSPAQGVLNWTAGANTFTYTPPPGSTVPFNNTVNYTIRDAVGTGTDTATVTLRVGSAVPVASDDIYTIDEDPLPAALPLLVTVTYAIPGTPSDLDQHEVYLPVMDNDVPRGDMPARIISVGDGGRSESFSDPFIDDLGNLTTVPNGSLRIDSGVGGADDRVVYSPRLNFSGTDFFHYTIEDADGDQATARVEVTVNAVNDAPIGTPRTYTTRESTTLRVFEPGLLLGVTDPDSTSLTTNLDSSLVPSSAGTLTVNTNGSFTFVPTGGWTGTANFTYRIVDDSGTSTDTSDVVPVDITVTPPIVVPFTPPRGTPAGQLPLAQVPLELSEGVPPNVLMVLDDSGSMNLEFIIESNARFAARAIVNNNDYTGVRADNFRIRNIIYYRVVPPVPGPAASSQQTSTLNFQLYVTAPTENVLADAVGDYVGNTWGIWRLRNAQYNRLYYDPTVRYNPWTGIVPNTDPPVEFGNADPMAAIFNPASSIDYVAPMDLTVEHTWRPLAPGVWGPNGNLGRSAAARLDTTAYLARYYRITDPDYAGGEPDHDTPHELVEIRPSGDTYMDCSQTSGVLAACVMRTSTGTFEGGPDRLDCATPMSCTYDEELQNFANWFTYYRSRDLVMRGVAGRTIADLSGLNLGLAFINDISVGQTIREVDPSFRSPSKLPILDTMYSTYAPFVGSTGTPLRTALDRAGRHFACEVDDIYGSAAVSVPGDPQCPVLPAGSGGECQAQFTLMLTDGEWNDSLEDTTPTIETTIPAPPGSPPGTPDTVIVTPGTSVSTDPRAIRIGNADADDPMNEFDGNIFADSHQVTLADIAMYYYKNDLHSTLDDDVPTSLLDSNYAPSSAFGSDPNTMHQHMKFYAVSFGTISGDLTVGTIPTNLPEPPDPTTIAWEDPLGLDLPPGGAAFGLRTGTRRQDDMTHATLNGRGQRFTAASQQELANVLRRAVSAFTATAGAASAVSFNSQQVQEGALVFRGFYNSDTDTGDLVAQRIDFDTNTVVEPPEWSAAAQLDDELVAGERRIVTYDTTTSSGIPFRHASLNALQSAELTEDELEWLRGDRTNERPVGEFRERLDELGLLGDIVNSAPVFVGPPSFIRRDSLSYPVSTSNLYSVFRAANADRQGVVYVGANDGMLHAIHAGRDADDDGTDDGDGGREVFAFVPDRLIRNSDDSSALTDLMQPTYPHYYYVDGTPAINDVFMKPFGVGTDSSREWRTVLVGAYRGGGRGLYALDITNPVPNPDRTSPATPLTFPDETAASNYVLWEFTDDDDMPPEDDMGNLIMDPVTMMPLLDDDGNPVKDLGYVYSIPTIAMTNATASGHSSADPRHKWAAVFGNGYNATYGNAKLMVVFIEDGADGTWDSGDVVKLDTGAGPAPMGEPDAGFPNGLGTPRLIDLDANGTADYAYAGDRRGYLYRFDMTAASPASWTSTVIFRATYPVSAINDRPQAITTQPIAVSHPSGDGVMIVSATGSFIADADRSSSDIQSIYGIWDRVNESGGAFTSESSPPTADGDRDRLVEQDVLNLYQVGVGALRSLTANEVVYAASDPCPADPVTGVVSGCRGWYMDFDAQRPAMATESDVDGSTRVDGMGNPVMVANPDTAGNAPPAVQFPGERAVRRLDLRSGLVFVNTIIPRPVASCESATGGFRMTFDPINGGLSEENVFDVNNDGTFDEKDLVGGVVVAGLRYDTAVPTDHSFIGTRQVTQLSDQTLSIETTNLAALGARIGRLSWREVEE